MKQKLNGRKTLEKRARFALAIAIWNQFLLCFFMNYGVSEVTLNYASFKDVLLKPSK